MLWIMCLLLWLFCEDCGTSLSVPGPASGLGGMSLCSWSEAKCCVLSLSEGRWV